MAKEGRVVPVHETRAIFARRQDVARQLFTRFPVSERVGQADERRVIRRRRPPQQVVEEGLDVAGVQIGDSRFEGRRGTVRHDAGTPADGCGVVRGGRRSALVLDRGGDRVRAPVCVRMGAADREAASYRAGARGAVAPIDRRAVVGKGFGRGVTESRNHGRECRAGCNRDRVAAVRTRLRVADGRAAHVGVHRGTDCGDIGDRRRVRALLRIGVAAADRAAAAIHAPGPPTRRGAIAPIDRDVLRWRSLGAGDLVDDAGELNALCSRDRLRGRAEHNAGAERQRHQGGR